MKQIKQPARGFIFWHSLLNLGYLSIPHLDSEPYMGHRSLVNILTLTFHSHPQKLMLPFQQIRGPFDSTPWELLTR